MHHATKWIKRHHHLHEKLDHVAPTPSYPAQPPTNMPQGSSGPAPLPVDLISQYGPAISPSSSSLTKDAAAPPSSVFMLPSPPPNEDCTAVTCTQPLTYTPAGSPCACVWPIEIKLLLMISPYQFFPLVSELAHEIATSVSLNASQARITGANAVGNQLDSTIVLINLVPLNRNFDAPTSYTIYQKFWQKQLSIKKSLFGMYEVVNVTYPGLPPYPTSNPSNSDVTIDQSDSVNDNNNNGVHNKPVGVDIHRIGKDNDNDSKVNGSIVVVVILSSVTAVVVLIGAIWLLLLKLKCCAASDFEPEKNRCTQRPSQLQPSGNGVLCASLGSVYSVTLSFFVSVNAVNNQNQT
ncbi:uncharacterized protein LOC143548720 [Bidens hawaiensis]|uniref:uncharacterized protein LOC143548720 n=1 Tax=Bidens hawaiensis TaxID=980011 RepID=UPI00404A31D2